MTRYRCAPEAQARLEPCYGTASHVRRWILLEQPGPWGRDAVRESRLPAPVATALLDTAGQVNARVILIRRPAGAAPARRRCYVARTDQAVVEELVLDDARDLLDVDFSPLADNLPIGGELVSQPLHLVCTNGRHDACCAEFGQPLVRAMAGAAGVWECSHIGGDRFAGNLVCFPHGLYFGCLDARSGPGVAALYAEGLIDLPHYRGRSCHPFAVQAAEYFLRVDRALTHVDDLTFVRRRAIAADAVRVTFDGRSGVRTEVDVRVSGDAEERRLTCQATVAVRPPRYELLAIASAGSGSSRGSGTSSPASSPRT